MPMKYPDLVFVLYQTLFHNFKNQSVVGYPVFFKIYLTLNSREVRAMSVVICLCL